MNFYISDLHFGHYNVLKYDNRPFSSIEEMDKKIIENWNEVVNPIYKKSYYLLKFYSYTLILATFL